jgi:hypothetical protein
VGIFSENKIYIIFYLFSDFLVPMLMTMSLDSPIIEVSSLRFDDQNSVPCWDGIIALATVKTGSGAHTCFQ